MTRELYGKMVVQKILNNNIVSSLDDRNREILVVGRGLGWKTKPGDLIDRKKIEKIFRMDSDESTQKLQQLFLEVEVDIIKLSAQIIDYAREILKKRLNKNVYITLTDHISFAIERIKQGIQFHNALQWEIEKLYPKEYAVGIYALNLIVEKTQIQLPRDEAGSVALHLVNAEYDCNMDHTRQMTDIIQLSLNLVKDTFQLQFNKDSLDYRRFTTHLLFFAQRMLEGKLMTGPPDEIYEMMRRKYPQQFQCAEKISRCLKKQYKCVLSAEEITFLAVHIVRVTTRSH